MRSVCVFSFYLQKLYYILFALNVYIMVFFKTFLLNVFAFMVSFFFCRSLDLIRISEKSYAHVCWSQIADLFQDIRLF